MSHPVTIRASRNALQAVGDRDVSLQAVAAALQGRAEIGDGDVHCAGMLAKGTTGTRQWAQADPKT